MLSKIIGSFVFFIIVSNSVIDSSLFTRTEVFQNGNPETQNGSIDKLHVSSSKCECVNYACGCCVHMDVPKLHLNDTGCVNLTYLPKDYGMTLTVTIDKWTVLNETVSARNPPPLCFGEEYLPVGGQICLRFYNLNASLTELHGCAEVYAKLKHIVLAKYDLGCFDVGHKQMLTIQQPVPIVGDKKVHVPIVFLP